MGGPELPFAIVFAISALISGALLLLSLRYGRIKLEELPTSNDQPPSLEEDLSVKDEIDPFDIVKAQDVVDGFPLGEDLFWAKVRLRKLALIILSTILVAIRAISFGWLFAAPDDRSSSNIAIGTRDLAFAIYILVLSVISLRQRTVHTHWPTVIHLSALTALGTFLLFISAILPSSSPKTGFAPAISAGLQSLNYAALAFTFAAACISSTIPRGPPLHFPPERIYSPKTLESSAPRDACNVCEIVQSSVWDFLMFSYVTDVVFLGYTAESLEIRDLPIVPKDMRATHIFADMRRAMRTVKLQGKWRAAPGTGWNLVYRLLRVNSMQFLAQIIMAATTAMLYYVPAYFLQNLIAYLETHPERNDKAWGWVYCLGLFGSNAISYIITGQLWSISTTTLQVRLKVQLNTILFAKTLVRKDVASSSGSTPSSEPGTSPPTPSEASVPADEKKKETPEDDFSSKAQIMTLMTTDVDRVAEFSWHFFSLVDAPMEIIIGTIFLFHLLGSSCFFGLGVTCLFLPLNHYASKIVVVAQDNLMKARDERVSLMNEILGGIRMLKFMAWERSFEARVLKVREKELQYQWTNYVIETFFNAVWSASPVLVTLVSFFHFTVIRGETLTPSIAFTSLTVFNELKFALNALPETFINILQGLVSVRRIEKYLSSAEVSPVQPLEHVETISLVSATVTWPQDRIGTNSTMPSAAPTPRHKFVLHDISAAFPTGELSLICGKLGSGKTLLLLALLGEADLLAGQLICPRSPPDTIAAFAELKSIPEDEWVVPGVCAYVPQTAWLQNASIRDNILFHLPYDKKRYNETLEACALVADLKILEDGDQAEIGERGVNLSGGQKARVSLARAVYSRASVILLDDVLSAVDAHTADHIFEKCIRGPLLSGRTVILVSHHVQLTAPGAAYVVALDNGRLLYAGDRRGFELSGVMSSLVQTTAPENPVDETAVLTVEDIESREKDEGADEHSSPSGSTMQDTTAVAEAVDEEIRKAPRKLVEEEKRAVGRIGRKIWERYVIACGGSIYWAVFITALLLGALTPVLENGWLRYWSGDSKSYERPLFYVGIYALVNFLGIAIQTSRWFILYRGSIHASTVLYKRLLQAVLFAHIRFHDTVSRGRLLNRFGKDFEGIDSSMSDNFGRTVIYTLSLTTAVLTITYVGGPYFVIAAALLGVFYFQVGKVYGQTSRDMRRLESVTRSPLYTIYGECIAGVGVLRAYGASTKFLRDMQMHVDTNTNPYYWMWSVNRWLSMRFNMLSSVVVGVTGVVVLINTNVSASFAGFALAFASTITNDLLFMVRRFVGLEQSMVALERVEEFSELPQEAPEFIEPRPPASWPQQGAIEVDNLVIRYAPQLPNVLHNLNFSIKPQSKIGVLGRTGGGKSTLALSFFRFVEATEGRILIDGVDISTIGLTDLRSRLTIIPQDPTILSGTLRSTLDVFDEYEDHEIFEALRRVHLIPSHDATVEEEEAVTMNANVFLNLDSSVSEGGDNFSAGEKQLICMARAILKRSRILFMDEATASVDYATDELISKTIRHEFAESTILTIAHRLRTVIDYDKVMLLDQGRIVEFDRPSVLIADPNSAFHSLCKSAGKAEFNVLKRMAEEASKGLKEDV